MVYSFDEIGQVCASFQFDGELQPGDACAMSRLFAVKRAGADDAFIGKVLAIRDRMVNVAVKGFVKLAYSGTAPTVGYTNLSGDSNGGVTLNDDGRSYLIVSVDIINRTVTILL